MYGEYSGEATITNITIDEDPELTIQVTARSTNPEDFTSKELEKILREIVKDYSQCGPAGSYGPKIHYQISDDSIYWKDVMDPLFKDITTDDKAIKYGRYEFNIQIIDMVIQDLSPTLNARAQPSSFLPLSE